MADEAQAGHLPNLRGAAGPTDPYRLPRQRRGQTPQMHGRYPDYDVLDEADQWDDLTRRVVLNRVNRVPSRRFFTEAEWGALAAFCDVVLAQDSDPRIPVVAYIDEKLHAGRLDGYQHADMPDDRETWRLVAQGLDEAAQATGAASYASAASEVRARIAGDFDAGKPEGGAWGEVNVAHAFSVVMRSVLAAFYSHPWAWNEIGFGGPAYPRGYARMGVGLSEAWEGHEAFDADPVSDVKNRGLE
jgi:Gluconate 2-dehydrogenase subunit 3